MDQKKKWHELNEAVTPPKKEEAVEEKRKWHEINEVKKSEPPKEEPDDFEDESTDESEDIVDQDTIRQSPKGKGTVGDWTKKFAVSYAQAIEVLNANYQKIYELNSEAEDNAAIPMLGGAFEEWYLGISNEPGALPSPRGKITLADIEKLKDDDAISLFSNIFYNNPTTMKNALDRKALVALIFKTFEIAGRGIYTSPEEDKEWLIDELAQGWLTLATGKKPRGW
jgi:hypothetical protein